MSDRLLDEAARMLRGMEERFGIPAGDIETDRQEPRSDDNTDSPVSTHPADGRGSGVTACCDLHGRNCEPPGELCCGGCTEAAHPAHADGSICSSPDLSGPYPEGNCYCGGPEEIYPHRHGTGYYCRPGEAP